MLGRLTLDIASGGRVVTSFIGGAGIPPPSPPPPVPGGGRELIGNVANTFSTPLSTPTTERSSRVIRTPMQVFDEGIARLFKLEPGGLCMGRVLGKGGIRRY